MTILRYALGLTAAVALAGAASAQTPQPADHPDAGMTTPPATSMADPSMPSTTDTTSAPPTTDMSAPAANTAGADVSATAGTQVIASAPVPDTAANRAKYGGPMSHAGKHTAAKGN